MNSLKPVPSLTQVSASLNSPQVSTIKSMTGKFREINSSQGSLGNKTSNLGDDELILSNSEFLTDAEEEKRGNNSRSRSRAPNKGSFGEEALLM